MSWFSKSVPVEYKIVEVSSPRANLKRDKETGESIATLSSHPGFVALLNRLLLQNQFLKSKLDNERHSDMREVDFLQSGIYWSNWLQQEVNREVMRMTRPSYTATDEEDEALGAIDSHIERVGE